MDVSPEPNNNCVLPKENCNENSVNTSVSFIHSPILSCAKYRNGISFCIVENDSNYPHCSTFKINLLCTHLHNAKVFIN